MARHDELSRQVIASKTGDSFTLTRKDGQTKEQFAAALQQRRSQWRNKFGIVTRSSVVGDLATIHVVQGLDETTEQVAMRLQTKSNGNASTVRHFTPPPAPAPAPPVEPAFVVEDEDARQFWKEMLLESLRVSPGAPFAVHAENAKQAVLEYQRRWKGA